MTNQVNASSAIDAATRMQLADLDGVASCGNAVDGTGNLLVNLVKDTPEVREAVLKVIGDKLPHDKVVFEKTGEFILH